MATYEILIDGGEGGEMTCEASTVADALAEGLDWARDGDWEDADGGTVTVTARNLTDDSDEASDTFALPTLAERAEQRLSAEGRVLGKLVREYDTEQILADGEDLYYAHPNGGERGAYDRTDGDGVWRDRPVEPSREIGLSEARRYLLDWGYTPAEIARLTRDLD